MAQWSDPDELFEGLREDAATLRGLPDLLCSLGLPEETWNAPMIPLKRLDESSGNGAGMSGEPRRHIRRHLAPAG